jgi:hypothetical protein
MLGSLKFAQRYRWVGVIVLVAGSILTLGVYASSQIVVNQAQPVTLGAGQAVTSECDNSVQIDPPGLTYDPITGQYFVTTISVSQISQDSTTGCGGWTMELALGLTSGYQMTSIAIPSAASDSSFYWGETTTGTHLANSVLSPFSPSDFKNIALQFYPGISCAQGGNCAVGDTGPGGGTIVYVASTPFTIQGTSNVAHGIEMAPANWYTGTTGDPALALCAADHGGGPLWTGSPPVGWTSAHGNVSLPSGFGYGLSNSRTITGFITGATCNASYQAAEASISYHGGGKTDWFLPSAFELNQVCRYVRQLDTTSTAACSGGTLRSGYAIYNHSYSSSSMTADQTNTTINFYTPGGYSNTQSQSSVSSVRPIRYF